ncbi:MAG: hypothetical protein WBC50_00365, partial [Dehalococcoidales bacterium]
MEEMSEKTKLDAVDIYNLAHHLMGIEGTIIFKHWWGSIKSSLERLTFFKDKETIGFVGKEAEDMLCELNKKYKYRYKTEIEDIDYEQLHNMLNRWRGRIDVIGQRWILSIPE